MSRGRRCCNWESWESAGEQQDDRETKVKGRNLTNPPLPLPAPPDLPYIYYSMGRVPFSMGGPAEAWCKQSKKIIGERTSKISIIRKGEMEVDKRENFPSTKSER